MTLDNQPIILGQVLFWKKDGAVKPTYKDGIVVDVNEHISAVKLRYAVGREKMFSQWFPLAKLFRGKPEVKA